MIKRFWDEYRFLSNFATAKVMLEGREYPTVEHGYVAAKTLDKKLREEIAEVKTPGQVKKLGRKVVLREDWNDVRLGIMTDLVTQKFQNFFFRDLLINTRPHELVEGNTWHDNFWGSCICEECGDKGENNLGKILMAVRNAL